jgi:hypothetical protein
MTAYEVAIEAHNAAQAVYKLALVTFRAGGSYEALAAAQAEMKIANEAFDAAYEVAANLPEEIAEVEDDTQIALF